MRNIILLILLSVGICSASLPTNVYGDEGVQEPTEYEMLGSHYNLWDMSYTTGNPNNDYVLWVIPVNDRLYSGDFYEGDTIYYQQTQPNLFYKLEKTSLNNWLTYDMRDVNNDGIVSSSELNLIQNRFFEKGEQTPIGSIFTLITILGIYTLYKYVKNKKDKDSCI